MMTMGTKPLTHCSDFPGNYNRLPATPVSGAAVYPVAVELKNPKIMTASQYKKIFFDDNIVNSEKVRNELIGQGYDGIKVIGNPRADFGELRATNYIAFDPSGFKPWFER